MRCRLIFVPEGEEEKRMREGVVFKKGFFYILKDYKCRLLKKVFFKKKGYLDRNYSSHAMLP